MIFFALSPPPDVLPVAALSCPAPEAPEVVVDFKNAPPRYRNDLTAAQLGNFRIDTTFSHGPNEVFTVGGLTESRVESSLRVGFRTLTHPLTGEACLWTDKVTVTVAYAPTVYIAKDSPPGTCRYNSTGTHELRHVNTDVITFTERLPALKAAIAEAGKRLGARGPLDAADLEKAEDDLAAALRAAAQEQVEDIGRMRFLRQQQIDTRQEYLRLGSLCREEKKKR